VGARPEWPLGQRAASAALVQLLQRPDLPYRVKWLRHAQRQGRSGSINTLAVARFLAKQYPWIRGGDATVERLRDTVHRALTGRLLSPDTLTLFIDGFAMDEEHADQLWVFLAGVQGESREAGSSDANWSGDAASSPRQLPQRGYETVSLHEFHFLGSRGSLADTPPFMSFVP
jgi:hypothetical protein